jgi:cob(I)alamin adenosyltransferase
LATLPEDLDRYRRDGFAIVTESEVERLGEWIRQLEPQVPRFNDWVLPGATPCSAALDFARSVCRRAERRAWALKDRGALGNPNAVVYLNRLADFLWIQARWIESRHSPNRPGMV